MGGVQSSAKEDPDSVCFFLPLLFKKSDSKLPILTHSFCDDDDDTDYTKNPEILIAQVLKQEDNEDEPDGNLEHPPGGLFEIKKRRRRRPPRVFDIYQTDRTICSVLEEDSDEEETLGSGRTQLPFRKCSRKNCQYSCCAPMESSVGSRHRRNDSDNLAGLWIEQEQQQHLLSDLSCSSIVTSTTSASSQSHMQRVLLTPKNFNNASGHHYPSNYHLRQVLQQRTRFHSDCIEEHHTFDVSLQTPPLRPRKHTA